MVAVRSRERGNPVAVVLAGGYALRHDHTVEIHCETVRAAKKVVGFGS